MSEKLKLKDLVSQALRSEIEPLVQAIKDRECEIKICPISEDTAKELNHFFDVITDIGDGDSRKGVETMRDNSKFIQGLLSTRNKISATVSASIITIVVAAVLTLIGLSIKESMIHIVSLGK